MWEGKSESSFGDKSMTKSFKSFVNRKKDNDSPVGKITRPRNGTFQ